jgi:peroxiredoxin
MTSVRLHPLQPGDSAPPFRLPAVNREGEVSLEDMRGRPFLIAFFRGLHCPFCRRQVAQLASMQPELKAAGVDTVAVINTPLERARLYFRYRPSAVTLLSDPECQTHRAFGVPRIEFVAEDGSEPLEWPHRASMQAFQSARINPTGELPQPTQPMEANDVLNAKDGFELHEADKKIFASHGTQLTGHFLIDAGGVVRWASVEAPGGPGGLCHFPSPREITDTVRNLVS